MALGLLALISGILTLIGIAMGSNIIIGAGVLLFFASFLVSGFVLSSIPTIVWVFLIILFIWIMSQKKK